MGPIAQVFVVSVNMGSIATVLVLRVNLCPSAWFLDVSDNVV